MEKEDVVEFEPEVSSLLWFIMLWCTWWNWNNKMFQFKLKSNRSYKTSNCDVFFLIKINTKEKEDVIVFCIESSLFIAEATWYITGQVSRALSDNPRSLYIMLWCCTILYFVPCNLSGGATIIMITICWHTLLTHLLVVYLKCLHVGYEVMKHYDLDFRKDHMVIMLVIFSLRLEINILALTSAIQKPISRIISSISHLCDANFPL